MSQQLQAMIAALEARGCKMRKTGNGFKCSSPWTRDTTPSFYIYENDGVHKYKCFSSEKQGDAIALLMELGSTFSEACEVTGQAYKLNSTQTQKPTYKKTRVKTRKQHATPTQTTAPHFAEPLQASTQKNFVSGVIIDRIKKAPNVFAHFFAQHCSKRIAMQIRDICNCMGGDPFNAVTATTGEVYFLYTDALMRVARIKVVKYALKHDARMLHGVTLKRTGSVRHIHKQYGATDSAALLYGLPYLQRTDQCVYVVESEKTVELLRVKTCHSSCVATGGNLIAQTLHAVQSWRIVLLPDMDKRQEWTKHAKQLSELGLQISVCAWWEGYEEHLTPKDDIGDLLQMMTRPQCFDMIRSWESPNHVQMSAML